MNCDETAAETAGEVTALVPQGHGGKLLRGGKPKNRGGGRPPESLYHWARLKQPEARKALLQVVRDKKHSGRVRAAMSLLELAERAELRDQQGVNSEPVLQVFEAFLMVLETQCSPIVAADILDAFLGQLEAQGLLPEVIVMTRFLEDRRGHRPQANTKGDK